MAIFGSNSAFNYCFQLLTLNMVITKKIFFTSALMNLIISSANNGGRSEERSSRRNRICMRSTAEHTDQQLHYSATQRGTQSHNAWVKQIHMRPGRHAPVQQRPARSKFSAVLWAISWLFIILYCWCMKLNLQLTCNWQK